MKQRSIGKDAVKIPIRQLKPEEILLPDLAARRSAGHRRKGFRAVQSDRNVLQLCQPLKVPARTAAKIENFERRCPVNVIQQCSDVLADIMIARAGAKLFGVTVVILKRVG